MLIDRYGVQLPTPYISTNNASSISINKISYYMYVFYCFHPWCPVCSRQTI